RRVLMLMRGENRIHLEHVQRMRHCRAQRLLVSVIAAIKMHHDARLRSTLAGDRQICLDRIKLKALGDLTEEFSFEMGVARVRGPHQLRALGDKWAERPETIA